MVCVLSILSGLLLGADVGWQPAAGGKFEYILQLNEELVTALSANDILSDLPSDLRGTTVVRLTFGTKRLPQLGDPSLVRLRGAAVRPQDLPAHFGWQKQAGGGYELIVQLTGESLDSLTQGKDLTVQLPAGFDLRVVRVTTDPQVPPRDELPAPAAATGSAPATEQDTQQPTLAVPNAPDDKPKTQPSAGTSESAGGAASDGSLPVRRLTPLRSHNGNPAGPNTAEAGAGSESTPSEEDTAGPALIDPTKPLGSQPVAGSAPGGTSAANAPGASGKSRQGLLTTQFYDHDPYQSADPDWRDRYGRSGGIGDVNPSEIRTRYPRSSLPALPSDRQPAGRPGIGVPGTNRSATDRPFTDRPITNGPSSGRDRAGLQESQIPSPSIRRNDRSTSGGSLASDRTSRTGFGPTRGGSGSSRTPERTASRQPLGNDDPGAETDDRDGPTSEAGESAGALWSGDDRWLPFMLILMGLIVSVAVNVYLAWIVRHVGMRYRSLLSEFNVQRTLME